MHILLTDHLVCPRCGPPFGLILLADRIEDRRVFTGRLGCANCREQFPITAGVVDLRFRVPSQRAEPAADVRDYEGEPNGEAAVRLAAMLGLVEGQGLVLVGGAQAGLAAAIAELLPHGQVVVIGNRVPLGGTVPGVTRVLTGTARLPFPARTFRGVALSAGDVALPEAARVLAPGARLVIDSADDLLHNRLRTEMRTAGLTTLLEAGGTVVASLEGVG